jgi:isopentenyl diphosphate isomerase/L-lactate dehydrogenase-like FMN-dependent dehydrogenase
LVDVSKVDTSIELFGHKYANPVAVAPCGSHRAYHPDGETAVAHAARLGNHLMLLSTQSTTSVEDVTKARGAPIWFQLYATNKFEVAAHHVRRAERAGCVAVAVTVDRSGGRNQETLSRLRPSDTRNCRDCHDRSNILTTNARKPAYDGLDVSGLQNIQSSAMSWDYVRRIRDVTKMKIVLKGIITWEDAELAAKAGIDAIIVSNHGGRSEDGGPSTIESLPEIIKVAGDMPVLIDSGFRRGSDVVKALCMGAKAVCVGRPYLWGLGAFGQPGVERALELLRIETRAMIQQMGAPNVKALTPAMVRRA